MASATVEPDDVFRRVLDHAGKFVDVLKTARTLATAAAATASAAEASDVESAAAAPHSSVVCDNGGDDPAAGFSCAAACASRRSAHSNPLSSLTPDDVLAMQRIANKTMVINQASDIVRAIKDAVSNTYDAGHVELSSYGIHTMYIENHMTLRSNGFRVWRATNNRLFLSWASSRDDLTRLLHGAPLSEV